MSETISIHDIGPVEGEWKFDLPRFGAYQLAGGPGAGKSTVLQCLNLLAGHSVELTIHDGSSKGRVEGFGRSVSLGKRRTGKGELGVGTLPERFDLSDLLNPAKKTPVARDSDRIKALASLTGTQLKPDDFYELVGGKDRFFALGIDVTDDPVLLTSRVKQALDREARSKERLASESRGEQKAEEARAEGIDVGSPSDSVALSEAVEKAAANLSSLRGQAKASAEQRSEREAAKAKLKAAEAAYDGPTIDKASALVDEAKERQRIQQEKVSALRKELDAAERALESCDHDVKDADRQLSEAEHHRDAIAAWSETLEAPERESPSEADISEAEKSLAGARQANENGVLVREAKAAKVRAKSHAEKAKAAERAAESLRSAAGEAFGILTAALDMRFIKIQPDADGNPRLKGQSPKRGWTNFDEVDGLSSAERIKAAVQELLLKLPDSKSARLFTVNQTDWQHMPASDLAGLDRYARENNVYIVGAKIGEGELRIESVNGVS